jgi:hypothetical protein
VASVEKERAEASAGLAETRAALELAWANAGEKEELRAVKETILKQLAALEAEATGATSEEEFKSIERRCRQLATKRAYWLEAPEVQADAESSIREMRTWGVPERYFDEHLKPLLDTVRVAIAEASLATDPAKYAAALKKAQTTLEAIFGEYQYWDWYTSKYVNGVLALIVGVVGGLGAVAIVSSLILAFCFHRNALAMFCAGLAGTCVSILLKQEPLAVYGDTVKSLIWSIGRLLTGVVATVIGMGLLTSGFISIGFSPDAANGERLVPLHVIVRGCLEATAPDCDGGGSSGPDGGTDARPPDGGARDAGRVRNDGGPSRGQADAGADRGRPEGGVARDGGPATQTKPQREPGKSAAKPACKEPRCPASAILLLLGTAMLFGFSERAFARILAQFEDKVGGGSPPSTPPPRATLTPVPPQGAANAPQGGANAPQGAQPKQAQTVGTDPPAPPKAPGTTG